MHSADRRVESLEKRDCVALGAACCVPCIQQSFAADQSAPRSSECPTASRSFELLSFTTLAPPEPVSVRFRPSRRPSLLAQQLQLPPACRPSETARAGHWQLYRLSGSGCPGQPSTDGGPPTRSFEQASRQTSASRRPSIIKPLLRPRPRQTFDRRHLSSRISSPLLPRRSSLSCTSSVGTPYRKKNRRRYVIVIEGLAGLGRLESQSVCSAKYRTE